MGTGEGIQKGFLKHLQKFSADILILLLLKETK